MRILDRLNLPALRVNDRLNLQSRNGNDIHIKMSWSRLNEKVHSYKAEVSASTQVKILMGCKNSMEENLFSRSIGLYCSGQPIVFNDIIMAFCQMNQGDDYPWIPSNKESYMEVLDFLAQGLPSAKFAFDMTHMADLMYKRRDVHPDLTYKDKEVVEMNRRLGAVDRVYVYHGNEFMSLGRTLAFISVESGMYPLTETGVAYQQQRIPWALVEYVLRKTA